MLLRNNGHVIVQMRRNIIIAMLIYFIFKYIVPLEVAEMRVWEVKWKKIVKEFQKKYSQ